MGCCSFCLVLLLLLVEVVVLTRQLHNKPFDEAGLAFMAEPTVTRIPSSSSSSSSSSAESVSPALVAGVVVAGVAVVSLAVVGAVVVVLRRRKAAGAGKSASVSAMLPAPQIAYRSDSFVDE